MLLFGAGWLGHAIGKSTAQERIQELQQEILRLHQVNRQREAELVQLRRYIERTQREIEVIRAQRSAFGKFARWIAGEHPEVVQRYQYIQQAEAGIVTIEQQGFADQRGLAEKYQALKTEFPKEIGEFEAKARAVKQGGAPEWPR